jgi:hypothetical protein
MAIPVKPKAGDFSGVKDSDFEAIEGVYNAKIGAMEHREAKPETAARYEQKNPGSTHPGLIHVEFHISDEPYDRRRVWTNVALNAEGMTKQFLQALGYTNDDLNDPNSRINSVGLEPEVEIGKSVRVRCQKSKNDETQTEVKAIMPPLVMSDLPA